MPDLAKLKLAIDIEAQDAYGSTNDELNAERAKSLDYYLGRPLGNEVDGRSQIVSHDVMDTIEWQKPALLRVFAGGDRIVRFDPVGPEDVEGAEQETDYVNHIVTQKNDWFTFCYDWISDALQIRNAYALAYWDENLTYSLEGYAGLTDDQLAFILKDIEAGRVQVVAHSQYPAQMPPQVAQDPMTGQPVMLPPPTLHDIQIRKVGGSAFAKLCVLPPERCLVSKRTQAMSLRDSAYFEYWDMKTISELREMGFDVPDTLPGDDANETEEVDQARNVGDILSMHESGKHVDPAMRRVKMRMIWVRHDYNEDGIAELNYVVRVGDEFLHVEETETLPVACIVPTIMPHRHIGLSTADNTHDIQEVKTMLLRGAIDNLFIANNTEVAVSNKVNLDDLLTSRPGGIKRVNTEMGDVAGHIMPYKQPVVINDALAGLEYMDQIREARTGTSRYTQGQDLQALNRTASGIAQLSSAASQRLELIARVISAGMKELFAIVHELTLKHSRMAETVMLQNKWVSVDPRQWKKRTDMTITVGMGVGNREQTMAQLDMILQRQMALAQMGVGFIRPENFYHTFSELTKAAGFAGVERFATDPRTAPPPKPQPDPLEVAKLQIQGFDAQTKRISAQAEAASKGREPVENAMDRKLDLVLQTIQTPPAPKGNGEDRPAPVSVVVHDPDKLEEKVAEVGEQLIAHLKAAHETMMNAELGPMKERLDAVALAAARKRKLVPVRGKRGRIERLEEQD